MSEEKDFPKGWIRVSLGELFLIERGGSPRPIKNYITDDEKGLNWIKIGDTKGITKYITKTAEKIRPEGLKKSRMVFEGDFILSNSMSFGRPYIMKTSGCIHDGWLVIRKNENVDNNFLYYALSSSKTYAQFSALAKGSTVKNLNIEAVQKVNIPLPPLPEQHRIVAKIEELFSSLDKGIESLKTAQEQLKIYRQAVLKWAFEGKLTNEEVKEGELPEGWVVEDLKKITIKAKKVKVKEQNQNEEFLYLDIGSIDNSVLKIVSHKNYQWKDAPSRAQQIIEVGDTLFSTVRTYLKNIAFVDKEIYQNQIGSSGFTVIRANKEKVESKYLFYYSTYQGFINPLNKLQTGTSYPAVRDEDVLSQPINYPILFEEQHRIVSEIESRLSVCDKIEESIANSLQQAELLRQSILKKAFEGKLVAQDSNDEPASVLLERIMVEREKNKPVKKTKKVKLKKNL